jgi:hypothetical protein
LVLRGGIYYEVLDRMNDSDKDDSYIVVLFFEDSILDTIAEIIKLKVELKQFKCLMEFKAFARNDFRCFNGRETQTIISKVLNEEVDIENLKKTGVI